MKKLFLLLLAVMAVFALVFTACEAAVNPDFVTQGYAKIENPEVTHKEYPGAVLLSWLPVKDARTYAVTRRDNETYEVKTLTTGTGTSNLFYLDTISYDNDLVDGRSYTYSVIATHVNAITGGTIVDTPVLNGKTEVRISAKVPADYAVPAITELNAVPFAAEGGDWVKITWKAGEYNPAVGAQVTYSYGTGATLPTTDSSSNSFVIDVGGTNSDGTGQKGQYATLVPLIGGANTVTVKPKFDDGLYYVTPAASIATKEVTGTKTSLGSITGFATETVKTVNGKKAIPLVYTGLNAAGNFDATAVEKLYRAEIVGKSGISSSGVTGNTVTNWTAVALDWTTESASRRTALDTGVAEDTSYAYILVLDKGGLLSNAATATGTVNTAADDIKIDSLNVTPYDIKDSTGVTTGRALAITFEGEAGAAYRLWRAKNIGSDTGSNATPDKWEEVTSADVAADATGRVVILDTGATKRTAWFYKVIATKAGRETVEIYDRDSNSGNGNQPYAAAPWNDDNVTYFSNGNDEANGTEITRSVSGTSVIISAQRFDGSTASGPLYTGESLVVYYKRGDVPSTYVLGTSITFADLTSPATGTYAAPAFTLPVAQSGSVYYDFKVFVKVGDKLLEVN